MIVFPEHKFFKANHDTFNEELLIRILRNESVQFKIDELNNKAKDYLDKVKLAKFAKNILLIKKATNIAWKAEPSEENVELFTSVTDLIVKTYDFEVDDLMICASFENFAKSKLLSNNYMVHIIDKPKSIKFKQKNTPITFSETIEYKESENLFINHNTISLGTILLNNSYTEALNIDNKIIDSMKIFRSYRNNIHFGELSFRGFPKKMLEGLIEYKNIIDNIQILTPKYPKYYGG